MNEKEKHGFKWLEKLKKIKHIEIYIAVIFIVILLLIFMSNNKQTRTSKKNTSTNELTITAYVDDLETNLEDILSNIGGVSNVKVMITLDMSSTKVEDANINLTVFPPVKGVLITAKGVNDISNKQKVLRAVEAVIDITNGSIEIISSD